MSKCSYPELVHRDLNHKKNGEANGVLAGNIHAAFAKRADGQPFCARLN